MIYAGAWHRLLHPTGFGYFHRPGAVREAVRPRPRAARRGGTAPRHGGRPMGIARPRSLIRRRLRVSTFFFS